MKAESETDFHMVGAKRRNAKSSLTGHAAVKDIFVILNDIRSSENVGSIFRTADAAGVSKIYVCGYTPAPLDRFKRENTKLAKAALGAETFVPWEARADALELLRELKQNGIRIAAVEQAPGSVSYKDFSLEKPTAFIFGNEVDGVSAEILSTADAIVEIPMHGQKESLNVSVAAGIVLFAAAQ